MKLNQLLQCSAALSRTAEMWEDLQVPLRLRGAALGQHCRAVHFSSIKAYHSFVSIDKYLTISQFFT